MKKIFISLLLPFSVFLSWQLQAQIRIDWQQCYGSLGEDRPYVITGTDSGIRVAGSCGADNGLVSLELSSDRGWIHTLAAQSWSMDGHVSGDYLCSNDTILSYSHQNFWVLHISDIYSNSHLAEQTEPMIAFRVCPNPVGDVLYLEFSPDAVPTLVELYDVQGRHVLCQRSGFDSIDIGGLTPGFYTLMVTLEGGKSYSDTIIKN